MSSKTVRQLTSKFLHLKLGHLMSSPPMRVDECGNYVNNMLNIGFCHSELNGKCDIPDWPQESPLGNNCNYPYNSGENARNNMHTGPDSLFLQEPFVPADPQLFQIQLNEAEVPSMLFTLGYIGKRNFWNPLKTFVIERGVALKDRSKAIEFMIGAGFPTLPGIYVRLFLYPESLLS